MSYLIFGPALQSLSRGEFVSHCTLAGVAGSLLKAMVGKLQTAIVYFADWPKGYRYVVYTLK